MPHRQPTTGPLLGLRILDLTRLLPGPLGTMLMADMGADVIKIEDPKAPDYVRVYPPHVNGESANYMALNRSKRSVLLDYQTPDGRDQFLDLVKTADVVVEQFRPGHLDRLGIGYAAGRAVNSRIIYVSVTGFGQTGPYAHLAGHDLNYIALAGVLNLTGESPDAIGQPTPPTIPGVQLADIAGGSYGCVMATLAAVYARERTGEGQHVDVSMTDAVMPLLSVAYAGHAGGQKFCTLIDKPDWLSFLLPTQPTQLDGFRAQIQTVFGEKSRDEWTRFGLEHDILITPVNTLDDLETDPHLMARQMIVTQEHPVAGPFRSIGVPLKFLGTPAHPAWPAPTLGEDTDDVLGPAPDNPPTT